jgi:hypothetical protein
MSEDHSKVIDLGSKELDPAAEQAYREKVKQAISGRSVAALKGSEPVGVEPRPQMPILRNQPKRDSVEAPQAMGGVQPRPPGSPAVRPETQKQLDEAIKAGQEQKDKEATAALDEAKLREQAALFEAFDFGDMNRQVDRILDNKKRRQDIESRCEAMELEDLLMKDEVRQRVPILPGKFEPTFRSITPIESLFIKRRMAKETITTDQYLGEKYNLMLLTCCLVDINGVPSRTTGISMGILMRSCSTRRQPP